ncbi:4'-phosphopantetheinyl transferase family protein [Streptomyces monticola]|uniref:4'-phosphopantetheinyl transferase family protein n=1 Tax=Streptomyces monticola TaxID=2666263 RepID=A0ABW2JT36_9ACTN
MTGSLLIREDAGPGSRQPPPGHLDIWLIRRPAPEATPGLLAAPELSPAERERAASFVRPLDGITYAAAHLALRRLLGGYLGIEPRAVSFTREPCPGCGEPHGRPCVFPPDPCLHFSLGHSHGMAVIGVASTVLGVDVELLPRDETVDHCVPALHPQEIAELDGHPPEQRREAFGQLWTRKEAYLKALGTGLSRHPATDYLGADERRRPEGWTVLDIPCGTRHRAAVAVRGDAPERTRVRRLRLERGATADADRRVVIGRIAQEPQSGE